VSNLYRAWGSAGSLRIEGMQPKASNVQLITAHVLPCNAMQMKEVGLCHNYMKRELNAETKLWNKKFSETV
jgi:hypothetical protein